MDETTSLVFYEMLSEQTQCDARLGELPGVLLRQSPPQIDDEVLIGSARPWRVHSVESYGAITLAWIVRADLPTPDQAEWITEIRSEFHDKGGLSIVLTPNGSILQWGGTDPDDNIQERMGERINEYKSTGETYTVVGLISERKRITPSEWVIDRIQSFSPTQTDSSYTQIHLCWCEQSATVQAA